MRPCANSPRHCDDQARSRVYRFVVGLWALFSEYGSEETISLAVDPVSKIKGIRITIVAADSEI